MPNRILYRIWNIYQKPVEELVELLGLDIPAVPDLSLAGITPESALFNWKPSENQPANLRHTIQVNGIKGRSLYISSNWASIDHIQLESLVLMMILYMLQASSLAIIITFVSSLPMLPSFLRLGP